MTDRGGRLDRATVEAALPVAVRAPSIHITQPWAWRLGRDGLALLGDRTRQLEVADPDGHSLQVSCGAALYLTELALRAGGWRRLHGDSRSRRPGYLGNAPAGQAPAA
jgi:hypothetical protein